MCSDGEGPGHERNESRPRVSLLQHRLPQMPFNGGQPLPSHVGKLEGAVCHVQAVGGGAVEE